MSQLTIGIEEQKLKYHPWDGTAGTRNLKINLTKPQYNYNSLPGKINL
jgi:hypothetical protein